MQTDRDYKSETIFQAIRLSALGIPYSRVGRRLKVPQYRVRFWVNRYSGMSTKEIAEAVELHRPGRPRVKR